MKYIKYIFVIFIVTLIVFIGGAVVLPDKQYFAKNTIVPYDPVAVYSKLSDSLVLQNLISDKIIRNCRYEIINQEKYRKINYCFENNHLNHDINGGFILEGVDNGTEITWFIEVDSLSFPLERWSGLATLLLKKKFFLDDIGNIESVLIN